MATGTLNSPGVSVSLIDDSVFTTSTTGTVPFVLVATAQNKVNSSNVVAPYTTPATAGQLQLLTSQRDLVNNFGAPTFQNVQGTPVNGSELNEYGLMAAYSALGVTDAVYVMRADVDLNALQGSLTPPSSSPASGTVWLDTSSTSWGIFQWNAATQTFQNISTSNTSGNGQLNVITNVSQTSDDANSIPVNSLGKPGDYAVATTNIHNPVWFKNSAGNWVEVGSSEWQSTVPAVVGANVSPASTGNLTINSTLIQLNGNLQSIIAAVNTAAITGVTATSVNNRFALIVTSLATNGAAVVSGQLANGDLGIQVGTYYAPVFTASPSTSVPQWNVTDQTPRPSGSVWFKTTNPLNGANFAVKVFNATSNTFTTINAPVAASDAAINAVLDPLVGGASIAAGSVYVEYDDAKVGDFTLLLKVRESGATTSIGSVQTPAFASGSKTFTVATSTAGSATLTSPVTITFTGLTATDFITALNSASISNVTAVVTSTGAIQLTQSAGGVIVLTDGTLTPLATAGFTNLKISNWIPATYVATSIAPTADPVNGTLWYFNSDVDYDIMINTGSAWAGYKTVAPVNEARGYDLTLTDPNGPIVMASQPLTQSDGTALALGDLWIDTSDLANFPTIYRFQSNVSSLQNSWILIDNTDHVSSNGIIFADARWATNGTTDPVTDPIPTIVSLLSSNYLDVDAPSPVLYPRGTLLFNTRRSSLNIKQYSVGHLNQGSNPPAVTNSWVTFSGNDENGVAYLASAAQRNVIVEALNAAVNSSTQITEEIFAFNLITCPGYPELHSALVNLNVSRNETAFIVGDSPMTLSADSTSLSNWANNTNNATVDGVNGLVTRYNQMSVYYPAGLSTDLSGNNIVVPASYMALRTIIQSDNQSFPWFAPAGLRRGPVDNATSVGYIDQSGDFNTISLNTGLRDVLYEAGVNPIANFAGSGLVVYGDKTTEATALDTAMSRINVARLVAYLRLNLDTIGKQYVFEPNDPITRQQIAYQITQFLSGIQTQRGLNDYLVDCSTDNNTPATIDANELNVSVAIEPTKTSDFIYIPITLQNTGTIASSTSGGNS